jgi:SPP1 gp7 family putative phage head morphogenesis protein
MSDYWAERAAQDMWEYMEDAEITAERISKVYGNSSRYIEKEIEAIYDRFTTKYNLTKDEAYAIIGQLNGNKKFDALNKVISNSANEKAKLRLAELESPAYIARIERFNQLQDNIDEMMRSVYLQENAYTTEHYEELSKKSYYRNMFNIQKDVGYGFDVELNKDIIDKVLKSKWSGQNYSSRIWNNTDDLSKDVQELLLEGLLTGESTQDLAKQIEEKYQVGAYESRRLIRTESAYVVNEMQSQSMDDARITNYRFIAVLDKKTSKVCRELDNKIFELKAKQVGTNYPPMHPFCRSTTVSVIDRFANENIKRLARDPNTGKLTEVPSGITYNEWHNEFARDSSNELNDFGERLGIRSKLDGLPKDIGQSILSSIEENYSNFPKLKNFISEIEYSSFNGILSIQPKEDFKSAKFSISKKLFSKTKTVDNTNKYLNEGIKRAYYNKNTDIKWLVNHEFGHILESNFISKTIKDNGKEHAWNLCSGAESILELASIECYNEKNKWKEVTKSISGYANTSKSETLAECVALELSGNGNQFSKEVLRILVRYL